MAKKTERTMKGLAAGMIGGLFASWVMNRFMAGMSKLKESGQESEAEARGDQDAQPHSESQDERADVKVAVLVAQKVLQRTVPQEKKNAAGQIVHYAYGTLAGGAYGLVAEHLDVASAGVGSLFGGVLWALSDEIGVPALGLSKGPTEYPMNVHLSALASHLVYGVATEVVRRGLRSGFLAD